MARAGVPRLVLASRWSSTARAATAARNTASRCRPARGVDLAAGRFDPTARSATRPRARAVDEDARRDPRNVVRRDQGRAGALAAAWVRETGGAARAALPQRLRAANAAGHAVRRGGGDVPVLAGARRAAAGLRGRRPRRDFVHVQDVAAPTSPPLDAVRDRAAGISRAFNVALASRTVGDWPPCRRGTGSARARGDRRLPPRRRPPHRRFACSGARGAGIEGPGLAGAGSARVRHGAASLTSSPGGLAPGQRCAFGPVARPRATGRPPGRRTPPAWPRRQRAGRRRAGAEPVHDRPRGDLGHRPVAGAR